MDTSENDSRPVLWHLGMSHYNEKARWALDWKRIPHTRRATMPGVHVAVAKRLAGTETFPILQIGDEVVADSSEIISALDQRWPARPLLPDDPAERERALELQQQFDTILAPAVRSLVYQHLLVDPDLSAKLLSVGGGAGRERMLRLVQPAMAPLMRKNFDVPPQFDDWPERTVLGQVEQIGAMTEGREFLVGKQFTVADLTAASFLAPLVCLDAIPARLPALPGSLQPLTERITAMPGGQWAAQAYRTNRFG
jgi:glutathione S-transferase